ncbi:MAG: type III-B CRISPR module-associated Cmr3 family protein, partial [Acidobacteriota bacterium]
AGDSVSKAAKLLGVPSWAANMRIAGPWLWWDGEKECPVGALVPMPADLARVGKKSQDGRIVRLHPLKTSLPGWTPPEGGDSDMIPLWYGGHEEIEKAGGYLDLEGLRIYLSGRAPEKKHLHSADMFFGWEDRSGIAVDADSKTAEDHMLYSARFLRLCERVRFYAEVLFGEDAPEKSDISGKFNGSSIRFGGEGRRVRVTACDSPFDWPTAENTAGGSLALLIAPGIFGMGADGGPNWRPDSDHLPKLRAAAVPGSTALSGWDLARRRPKPTRHAVNAGAVYFFEGDGESPGNGAGPFVHLCGNDELDAVGYGLSLQGGWKHDDK